MLLALFMLAFVGTAQAAPGVGLPSAAGAPNAAVVAARHLQVYHAVNGADGATSLVVDFSTVASFGALFDTASGATSVRFFSPWAACLAPDGTRVVLYRGLGERRSRHADAPAARQRTACHSRLGRFTEPDERHSPQPGQ